MVTRMERHKRAPAPRPWFGLDLISIRPSRSRFGPEGRIEIKSTESTAVFALAALAAFALAGCAAAHQDSIATPVTVEIPVATPVYCSPPPMDKPALALAALSANSTPADTIRAYAATVAILKGAVTERDDVIAGCAKPAPRSAGK